MYSGFNHYDRKQTAKVSQVNDPNGAWMNQEPHWGLIEDLIGGTYEVRRRHRRYLPQEPRELDEAYDNRLARSTVPPYFVRLERMLAGMLTRKPVRLNDVSDTIREQLFDVDLGGNDLNVWCYETARRCIRYGHVGVLVDAPAAGSNGRPYWVSYTPREILGARFEQIDGAQKLVQLRLAEKVIVPDGDYGEKQVEQVRGLEAEIIGRQGQRLVEWCAGKGHLSRLLARRHDGSIRALEWQPALCESGQALAERARANDLAICYVNCVGGQDELVFDGRSCAVDRSGQLTLRAPAFESGVFCVDTQAQSGTQGAPSIVADESDEALVYDALVRATRDYVDRNGFPGALIGASGGSSGSITNLTSM